MKTDEPTCNANARDRRPSDRLHALLGWACLGILAGIVLFVLVIARYVAVDRATAFRLAVLAILVFNALWWLTADHRLARFVPSRKWSIVLRTAAALFSAALIYPIVYMLWTVRMPAFLTTSPAWYAAAVTLWHLGLVTLMPIVAAIRLAVLAAVSLARRLARTTSMTTRESGKEPPVNLVRRSLLHTACVSVPIILLGSATVAARRQERDLLVRRHALKAPWLPDRLRGLTITHVSDLHVGRHYRPHMLPRLIDVVNDLDSDIILLTGDIVDVSNDMLPPAIHAIGQMQHRYGLFNCIGNHDEIDDRSEFIADVRHHLPLLIDEHRVLEIDGERITIAGLDYAHGNESTRRDRNERSARAMLSGHDPDHDGPIIALAHHPHAFDCLADHRVPLTLSGHTHGGQLMLTPPSSDSHLGAGSLLFRYVRGFYRAGNSTLFVNSGVGNWFPLRIHAPAEVVQIQLI